MRGCGKRLRIVGKRVRTKEPQADCVETVVGENLERILRRCSRVGSVPGEIVRMVRKSVDVELYCLAVDTGLQKNSAKLIVRN